MAHAQTVGEFRVDRPEHIGPTWEAALAADRPVVIDAVVDPDVPPLPPHVTRKQARALSSALLKGDPDRGSVIRRIYKEVLAGWTA